MASSVGGRSRSHGLPLLLPGLALLAVVLSLHAPGASSSSSPGRAFHVGVPSGWRVPNGRSINYFWSATVNNFYVGDVLYFKYANDSVLLVDQESFLRCNPEKPVAAFDDGATTFRLNRTGLFYFISGNRSQCVGGQRIFVRVTVDPAAVQRQPGASSCSTATVAAAVAVAVAAVVSLVLMLLLNVRPVAVEINNLM